MRSLAVLILLLAQGPREASGPTPLTAEEKLVYLEIGKREQKARAESAELLAAFFQSPPGQAYLKAQAEMVQARQELQVKKAEYGKSHGCDGCELASDLGSWVKPAGR
jgi:hypothetical protein